MLTKSKHFTDEYCCTIVKIGDIQNIPNSDFLGITIVEGREIVIRKDQVKKDDLMFYVSNECEINSKFLQVNNLYSNSTLNLDTNTKGYFNDNGRVKMIRLRGQLSMGFLFTLNELLKYVPDFNEDLIIGTDFDMIGEEWFVKPYIPKLKYKKDKNKNKSNKRNKKLKRFNQIIPGTFEFHYDTNQLLKNINKIKPTDVVAISNKLHGTSFICGNILTNKPKWKGFYEKIIPYLPKCLQFTKLEYDYIYSSRTVIKNEYINKSKNNYYESDIWGEYKEVLKNYIPKNVIVYGEIVGYLTDSNSMIQKEYDYGCEPGENKLMLYRVVVKNGSESKELNVSEVFEFTVNLIEQMRYNNDSNVKRILPIDIFYIGTLQDLFPEIPIDDHWGENILSKLKQSFGLELLEPYCINKVPREGFVLRIENDPIQEAFKLKSIKFLEKESKAVDKGFLNLDV